MRIQRDIEWNAEYDCNGWIVCAARVVGGSSMEQHVSIELVCVMPVSPVKRLAHAIVFKVGAHVHPWVHATTIVE
jgi:hypothetical protein